VHFAEPLEQAETAVETGPSGAARPPLAGSPSAEV
jgi:hypothetical protein